VVMKVQLWLAAFWFSWSIAAVTIDCRVMIKATS
jgi:hypothetical protein